MKPLCALAIAATVLTSWSAVAETRIETTSSNCRSSAYGPSSCTTTTTSSNGSETPSQRQMGIVEERLYREEREARIRKWEEFCKPSSFVDDMNITRLRYAHPGCDLGRNSDGGAVAQVR
jgi:hypothetical protein